MADSQERKKISPVTLVAGIGASILSAFVGSKFGIRGTYIGTAIGTLVSGTTVVWIENAAMKTNDKIKGAFSPDELDSTSLIPAVKVRRSQRKWLLAGAGLVMALITAAGTFGVLGIIRGATGKTLGQDSPARPQPVPVVTQTVLQTIPPSPTFIPSATASQSPTPTSSPSPSLTPSKLASRSATPSSSPSPSSIGSPLSISSGK